MKSIRNLLRQDREKYVIPRRVQDVIPIQKIWEDGIFLTGGRYAKTFRFTDINYQVASEPDKEKMFRGYSALINSLDCGATTKITIHHLLFPPFSKFILNCGFPSSVTVITTVASYILPVLADLHPLSLTSPLDKSFCATADVRLFPMLSK